MIELEHLTAKEVIDYYVGYIMEHELAATKSQARQLLLNALTYNIVREAVIDQIAFLTGEDD